MLGKGEGRRALRLTSLSLPVEEEICNTGLSHGQKGGWGNEDFARLRSFLVWETVFAHKRSCGRRISSSCHNSSHELFHIINPVMIFFRIRRAPTKAFAGYTKLGGCVGLMTRTSRYENLEDFHINIRRNGPIKEK